MSGQIRGTVSRRRARGARSSIGFPIVCIGTSSGALPPLEEILREMGTNTGAAFLVIHHLRRIPSLLPDIIPRWTSMPVDQASAHARVQPNHVYIIPSGQDIAMTDGHFSLRPNSKNRGWPTVMTLFLNSLLQSHHPGIAVVLSGGDSNGTGALKNFKRSGGITIVQDPGSAERPEMPRAAIESGCADYVLRPGEIAAQIQESVNSRERRTIACRVMKCTPPSEQHHIPGAFGNARFALRL